MHRLSCALTLNSTVCFDRDQYGYFSVMQIGLTTAPPMSKGGLSTEALIGIGVSSAVVFAALVALTLRWFYTRRRSVRFFCCVIAHVFGVVCLL